MSNGAFQSGASDDPTASKPRWKMHSTRQDAQINYLSTLSIFMKQTTYLATLPNPKAGTVTRGPVTSFGKQCGDCDAPLDTLPIRRRFLKEASTMESVRCIHGDRMARNAAFVDYRCISTLVRICAHIPQSATRTDNYLTMEALLSDPRIGSFLSWFQAEQGTILTPRT
jgi:hypothetical protein